MELQHMPEEVFYLINQNLTYKSFFKLKLSCRLLLKYKFNFFIQKANIIVNFIKKKFYYNFVDLKNLNRKGYLINSISIFKNPNKYKNKIIQCISSFQYDYRYIEIGSIIEGNIYKDIDTDAWVILDNQTKKIHPFINLFILKTSFRIIK
jgi:hypothetical protein